MFAEEKSNIFSYQPDVLVLVFAKSLILSLSGKLFLYTGIVAALTE